MKSDYGLENRTCSTLTNAPKGAAKPIEQCASEAFGTEDFGPFREGQVRGDQSGAALVALAKHLEEQLS